MCHALPQRPKWFPHQPPHAHSHAHAMQFLAYSAIKESFFRNLLFLGEIDKIRAIEPTYTDVMTDPFTFSFWHFPLFSNPIRNNF